MTHFGANIIFQALCFQSVLYAFPTFVAIILVMLVFLMLFFVHRYPSGRFHFLKDRVYAGLLHFSDLNRSFTILCN